MLCSENTPPSQTISDYYDSLSSYWLPVAKVTDVDDKKLIPVTLLGKDIVVVKIGSQYVAFRDLCCHFQARLSAGTVEEHPTLGSVLRCTYHGWAFGNDGNCVEIPQLEGSDKIPKNACVTTYATQVKHDLVWVCFSGNPGFSIPDFPETQDDGMMPTSLEYSSPWPSSMIRMILSVLDDYHFPWLHDGILGDRSDPRAPNRKVICTESSVVSSFFAVQPQNVTNTIHGTCGKVGVDYIMHVDLPNIIRLIKKNDQGGLYVVLFFPFPISYVSGAPTASLCLSC